MTNRYLYIWLCITLCGDYFCQNYKTPYVIAIAVVAIAASMFLFFWNRFKSYKETCVSHYKVLLVCEISVITAFTGLHMALAIFVLGKDDGVQFLINLLLLIPSIPVVLNTARMNRITNKSC